MLKGRANYLCLRRWGNFRKHPPQNLDELRTLVKVLIWLPRTGTGDRAELLLVNGEPQAWSKIAVSEEGCPLHECIHNQKGLCFFYRARRLAEAAHVIVVNHALLLADIATENRVLPPFQHLIIDEAHHLEDGATDQLGYTVGQSVVPDLLGLLSRPRADRRDGLLADLQRILTAPTAASDLPLTAADRARVQALVGQMQAAAERAVASNQELFAALHRILEAGSEERNEYDKRLRLTSPVRKNPLWGEVQLAWDNLDLLLTGLLDDLTRLTAPLEDFDLAQSDELEYLVPELLSLWHNLAQAQSRLQATLASPSSGAVYWLSSNARDETTTLHCAPLHVGELLDRYLFQTKRTTVLTSATLSTDGDFAYVRERLGLQTAEELHLGSPYDYVNSTLLYVPSDLPEPNQPGYQRQLEQTLVELCRATRGRALVLFTSHSALRATYRAIQRPLEESGLLLLGHNLDGSRRQLLERFRSTEGCVLMGTSSFWEGIDVAGEALSVLVIAKLPFRVPSDPVFAARSEQFDDPFAQYSLPQAILRFKQGFGRLIRTRRDRGIVAILDSRVVTKRYGATFLNSLPVCTLRTGSASNLGTQAEEWLARRPIN